MVAPNDLNRIASRQEKRGAKVFFRALKTQYTELAKQYENGQSLEVDTKIIKSALIDFHTKTQIESAEWQYNDLEKRNPVKKLQLGIYDRLIGLIRAWVLLNIGASIQSISNTTLDIVRRVIAKGQEEGFGARKIGQLIRQEAKSQFTAYRSTVIARTEGTRAASQGHKFGAEQWEKITGQKKWKGWSAANQPNRTRPDHLNMIGSKPIPGDEKFKVGDTFMDAPGDPAGGAKECVGCRCRSYYMSERMARSIINS